MLRAFSRFLSLFLTAAAFAALIIDATRSMSAGRLVMTPLSQTAMTIAPTYSALLQRAVEHRAPLLLYDPILVDFVRLPNWLVLGAAGLLFFWLGRKPRAKFGFSSR